MAHAYNPGWGSLSYKTYLTGKQLPQLKPKESIVQAQSTVTHDVHAVPLTWVLLQDAFPRAIREGFPQHFSPLTVPTGDIPLRVHDCFFHCFILWFLFFG